jgi:predicted ATPase/class 3 adenylate cyclase
LEALASEGPLPLGGAKQRALLALLILNANRVVSRERMIDELWGEDPPETAVTSVQVYVSRLRKLLPEASLVTRPPGYLLEAETESVDLLRFERLSREGRDALAAGDPERAARVLREALDLWRGPALAEFANEPFAQIEGGRLDDLRVAALEERIEADLALGRHAELMSELEALIASNPHREKLREQQMLALYRSGRQTEALEVYRNVRAMLDEIGIEPGANLQRVEKQILNHDAAIDAPLGRPLVADAPADVAEPTPPPSPVERKRVTVLFAAMGTTNEEDEDPEQTAMLFDRLHAEAAVEIEAEGGTVEKGLVGALLATFGAAAVEQDDHAAHAARAALATQGRLTRMFGETISLRMALESGDVILGRPGSLVMGTPVTASARLVGFAQPGDIVVGHRAAQAIETEFELRERGQAHVLARARAQPVAREVRKTVTVLFADLVESTRLGHELEPEALSLIMSDYFRAMQSAVTRHGGIVEKFIGDAVMAVFGVPVLHEDDALRAVRAAAEMRESLAKLDKDFDRTWGIRLQGRIGINTGEVMAGDHLQGHLIVTGRAVNVAKRLEEAAATDEILLSEATHRLVRDAVVTERVSGRVVKGGETLGGLALVEVRPHAPGRARRFETPLVDREQEFTALLNAFESVVQDRQCHLLTVLGEAGVGKSRLIQEFAREIGADAMVLHGRCLPYGEGITYWPLLEVVRDLVRTQGPADAEPSSAAIAALLPDEERVTLVAELISEALGLVGSGIVIGEQTFWAFRKLFEGLARRRPLVIVFDDLQWAEPTFLELIDYLAGQSRDAPVLLLCVARPELFDSHPGWGGGKRHAATTSLDPLREDDSRRLIANLLGRGPLPAEVEQRIADAAEGNALFTEELLAMLVDDKRLSWEDGRWVVADDLSELGVPQEINAFLAARLERLPAGERALIVRASVEGAVFHYGALRELAPESSDASLQANLASLVRRDIIRPARSDFPGDQAYRFRHLLIRDAAYWSLAKSTRSALHERFATWLERTTGARIREEIVGYHLEQGYRCRVEIGSPEKELTELGARASLRLGSAGRRALARSDLHAAVGLLKRAAALVVADSPGQVDLLSELGAALIEEGELKEAEVVLDRAMQAAKEARNELAEARVLVHQQFLRLRRVAGGGVGEAAGVVQWVLPVFERQNDHAGLCGAWRLQAWLHWNKAHAAAAGEAFEQAAAHASLAGDEHAHAELLTWVASALWFGPTPVTEAINRCEEIRSEVSGHSESEALLLRHLGGLHAMTGNFELARSLLTESNAVFEDLGPTLNAATSHNEAVMEFLADDPAAAERSLRGGYCTLREMGEQSVLSTTAAFLARAVLAQGRDEEAEELTAESASLAEPDDLLTQLLWRGVQAAIFARRGLTSEAEALAREAVAIGEQTDFLAHRGDTLVDLAHILQEAEREEEAAEVAAEGLHLHEQKGNVVTAGKIRSQFGALV